MTESSTSSSISILTNIITSPQQAFKDIQHAYPILLPFLAVVLMNAVVVILLFASIDYEWYVDHMVEAQAGELSRAEQDQTRAAFEMMSPSLMSGFGAGGVIVGIGIMYSVMALYFVIVSNVTNDGFQFKQWFSFISWTSIPTLIGALASLVIIITSSNGQFAPESINPLTLNELFFGLNPLKGVGSILAKVDITMFWSIALMTIGYAQWTEKSIGKAFGIVILPYLIFYGISFLFI
ncbi:YIP1 family protein [Aliikangiella sp. IMCC44359]|uniref:YIP1 family protein n=1 Tax=Aliikangiella sp. IMCC44359 TaxID=3459125 RepID=UPI00403AC901